MPKKIEIVGKTFGNLTVVAETTKSAAGNPRCICRCVCGNEKVFHSYAVTSGWSKSCGCLRKAVTIARNTTHGLAKRSGRHPDYGVWAGIHKRCENPNAGNFKHYGGRGIKVCESWKDFETFLSDIGDRPTEKHSIERIDVNGDYCPENCRWATQKEQCRNTRDGRTLTVDGVTKPLAQWAEEAGVKYMTLYYRIKRGTPAHLAVKP